MNKVILNRQRSLWEGDWRVVKRSCRHEPMWVVTHMCMEAMLGISLYNYLYLKLAKTLCLSYYLLPFVFNKIEEECRACSAWKWGCGGAGRGRDGPNNVYTYDQDMRSRK
jgi:hypothetical protein